MNICLSIDDFNEISLACESVSSEWEKLAKHLKISRFHVEVIRNEGKSPESCLDKLLTMWLRQPSPIAPKPSWRVLCNALSRVDGPLSEKIWREHPCGCGLCKAAGTRATPVSKAVKQEKPTDAAMKLDQEFQELLDFLAKEICKIDTNVLRRRISNYFLKEGNINDVIEEHLSKIEGYDTPNAILNYFHRHGFLGYINYYLITIFQGLANSPLLDKHIEEYENDYKCFLKLSLTQVHNAFQQCPDLHPDYPAGIPKFTIHLESEWDGKSVFELKELLKRRFDNSDCIDQLMIAEISKNCIIVTFAVLPHITQTILRYLTNDDVISILKKEGIAVDISKQLAKYQQKTTEEKGTMTTNSVTMEMQSESDTVLQDHLGIPMIEEHPIPNRLPSADVLSMKSDSDATSSGYYEGGTERDSTTGINFSSSTTTSSMKLSHIGVGRKKESKKVVQQQHTHTTTYRIRGVDDSDASPVYNNEPDDHKPTDSQPVEGYQRSQEAFLTGNMGNHSGLSLPVGVSLHKGELDFVVLQALFMLDKMDEFMKKLNRPSNMPPLVDETTLRDIATDQDFQLPMTSPMERKSPHSSLYTAASLEGVGEGNQLLESIERVQFSKADGVLKNTMDALMHIKETPSKLYISMEDLKDIICSETVRCNLLLAVVIGLPNCGKSNVIRGVLKKVVITPAIIDTDPQKHSMQCYVANGLSSYSVVIVGRKPFDNLIWIPETRQSMHMFACTSTILRNGLIQNQQVIELVDSKLRTGKKRFKGFKESALNTYMHRVYNDVDFLVEQCNLNPEISRILPSGVTSVNIIDAALNQGVYDFLTLTSRYCQRQFGFIFLDLKRDIPALHETPDIKSRTGEDRHMLQLGSRIFYLVRFAAVSYFSTNCTSSLFVAVHDGTLSESEIETLIGTLREAISEEIRQQNLPSDMVEQHILSINPEKKEDLKRLKTLLETFVKSRRSAMLDLKLSYVFFRSLLSNDSKYSQLLFLSLGEIQKLCRDMGFDESETEDFLHTYTEFGSILFMKDILPDVVILQPAVFVNYLQKLFYPQKHDSKESSNGIMSMSEAHRILGNANAATVVIPFLVKSGLGVELDRSEVSFSKQHSTQPSTYLFIPSSRPNILPISHDLSTLYIYFSSKIAPPNMAGTFLQKLLKLGYLIPSNYRNQLLLKLKNGGHELEVIFDPEFVSLKLQVSKFHHSNADIHVYKNILFQCNEALSDITILFPDLTYDYGLQCLYQPSNTHSASENMMCDHCRSSSVATRHKTVVSIREDWCNAVKEVQQSKDKAVEKLSLESLIEIAEKISTIERVTDAEIMSALSLSKEEQKVIKSTYHGDRHIYILSMLLAWVTKIGKDNATKQKLYKTLFHASTQFIHIF